MKEKELRELDAWIAENVMGWTVFKNGRGNLVAWADIATDKQREYIIDATHPWDSNEWNPTTDPAAAFEVLRKIAERWSCSVFISQTFDKKQWTAQAALFPHTPEAETPELAICLLARKIYSEQE